MDSLAETKKSTLEQAACFVAVHLFLFRGNQTLLLRRRNTGYEDGLYSVIAGKLEPRETIVDAIIREAKEEAGIEVAPNDLSFAHVAHNCDSSTPRDWIAFFFAARRWQKEPSIMEPDKCDDMRWCDLSHIPDDLSPYIRQGLLSFINGDGLSLRSDGRHLYTLGSEKQHREA